MVKVKMLLVFLLNIVLFSLIFTSGCSSKPANTLEEPSLMKELHGIIVCAAGSSSANQYTNFWFFDTDKVYPDNVNVVEIEGPSQIEGQYAFVTSPNGNQVAFISDSLRVLDLNNFSQRSITSIVGESDHYIAWHPRGNIIAYIDQGDLFIVNVDGTSNERLATHNTGKYFTETPGGITIPENLQSLVAEETEDQIRNPVWLFNGGLIAFNDFSLPEEFIQELGPGSSLLPYVIDLTSKNRDLFKDRFPEIDPLADKYLYIYNPLPVNLPLKQSIYLDWGHGTQRLDWDGNKWTRSKIYNDLESGWIIHSSDSNRFLIIGPYEYYGSDNRLQNKFLATYYSSEGRQKQWLLPNKYNRGCWSPDGRFVAISSEQDILVLEPNTGQTTIIPTEEKYLEVITWVTNK